MAAYCTKAVMYIPPGFIALLLSKLLVPMDTIGVMYSWLNYDIIGGCKEGGEQNRPRTDRILYKKIDNKNWKKVRLAP